MIICSLMDDERDVVMSQNASEHQGGSLAQQNDEENAGKDKENVDPVALLAASQEHWLSPSQHEPIRWKDLTAKQKRAADAARKRERRASLSQDEKELVVICCVV